MILGKIRVFLRYFCGEDKRVLTCTTQEEETIHADHYKKNVRT